MPTRVKPGFHIVVSVVSVVRKKFIGQLQLYGNLPYKCSIQKKQQIQLFVRDRMNSICPMNFLRTTDTTDTTIWKPDLTFRGHVLNTACLQTVWRSVTSIKARWLEHQNTFGLGSSLSFEQTLKFPRRFESCLALMV